MARFLAWIRQMAPWLRCYLVAVVATLTFSLVPTSWQGAWAMVAVVALAVGFSLRMKPFIVRLWASTVAKVLFGLANVVVVLLAHVLASRVVAGGLGFPPEHFEHTVHALTLVFVVVILASATTVFLGLLSFVLVLSGMFLPAVHRDTDRAAALIFHGVGAFALLGFVANYLVFPLNWVTHPPSWTSSLAYELDFYEVTRLPGAPTGERVATLDDGWLAVARAKDGVVTIELQNATEAGPATVKQ